MSELRFTDTKCGATIRRTTFGLDGNLYLPLVDRGHGGGGCVRAARPGAARQLPASPVSARRSPSADTRLGVVVEAWQTAGYDATNWTTCSAAAVYAPRCASTHTKSHDRAPDGRLVDGLIVLGRPSAAGRSPKGFWLEPPDLRGASFERLNAFQDQLRFAPRARHAGTAAAIPVGLRRRLPRGTAALP